VAAGVTAALAAAPPAPRAAPRPALRRWSLAGAGVLAVLACFALLSTGRRGAGVAYADSTTPGQLTILDADGKPAGLCPLKHTDVRAEVSGYVAAVTVTQRFENPSNTAVEAVYTFPLPADAAVDDMTMLIGDRVIRGQIRRREEARAIYDAAREQGKAAALLDQERPNVFTQSVANLMPGQEVRITIRYVNLLKYDDGRYEFHFPMVVGPRFTTGSSGYTAPGLRGEPSPNRVVEGDPGAVSVETDAERITPPIAPKGMRAGHDISVSVALDAGVPLGEVKSVLHQVDVDRAGEGRATVRLREAATIPNKDFVLRFTTAGREIETGLLAHAPEGDGSGYFTLILQPPVAPPADQVSGKEMVFVIDQTGSQSGAPIEKAKEVIRELLNRLNRDDTFQLIGFNTDVFPCFPAPVPPTPENLRRAAAFLAPLQGEGGTDILKSTDFALRIPDDPARLRMICYLTDGYVGNDMQIAAYVRQHRGRARMFPIGVGDSVNRFCIESMAREGRGMPDVITLTEDAKDIAERFYRRVRQPLLLDPSVDWGGLPVADVYPQVVPDVFTSGPIILKGRYTGPAAGEITVRGLLRGRPWSQTVPVSFPAAAPENSALPTLWAREKIEDLQSADYLAQQMGRPTPDVVEQIVALALDYRLMTQHTSFVAVEERVVNVGGRQRTVDVPVEMPHGVSHEGIFGREEQAGEDTLHASKLRAYSAAPGGMAGGTGGLAPGGAPAAAPLPPRSQAFEPTPLAEQAPAAPLSAAPPPVRSPQPRRAPRLMPEAQDYDETLSDAGRRNGDGYFDAAPGRPEDRIAPALLREPAGKTVAVELHLSALPKDGAAILRRLGFRQVTALIPGRVLLGEVSAGRLRELAKLPWVRRIEPARFRDAP